MIMNDKFIYRLIIGVSIFVLIVVVILQSNVLNIFPDKSAIPSWVFFLPTFNAIVNGTCSILLLLSLYFIKRKDIETHKKLNILTFILSSFFLVSYIIFHATGIKTTYGGEGFIRTVYYFILITHIILAAVVLPLVLFSFQKGLQMQVVAHKKLVRWTYPIWLYVTVTGVIVYLMISPYYTF
jgi:putative membrane protein